MKVRALFPDGFRTGQTPNGQTDQISLLRVSFSNIPFPPVPIRLPHPISSAPLSNLGAQAVWFRIFVYQSLDCKRRTWPLR